METYGQLSMEVNTTKVTLNTLDSSSSIASLNSLENVPKIASSSQSKTSEKNGWYSVRLLSHSSTRSALSCLTISQLDMLECMLSD